MAIMFKKTVVVLFLLSQVLALPDSSKFKDKTRKACNITKVKAPTQPTTMRLRPRSSSSVSPLAINELSSGSVSSLNSVSDAVEEGKPLNDVELVHFLNDDTFEFLGFLNQEPNKASIECLIEAIYANNLNSVRSIAGHVDLNSFANGPRTPFMLALQNRNPEIVDALLITGNVDPNIFADDGCNIVSLAAFHLGFDFVEKIINGPIKLSTSSAFMILSNLKKNSGPIFRQMITAMANTHELNLQKILIFVAKQAVIHNDLDLARFMYSVGIPLNTNYRAVYFIHLAAFYGHVEMVNLLIECGTPIDILTLRSQISPLMVAYDNKKYDLVVELIEKGASYDLVDCIYDAVLNNNIPIIQAFLSKYLNLANQFTFENGLNLVTLAISEDKPDLLQFLLNSENINSLTKDSLGNNIYNMSINESASEELKEIIQKERNFAAEFVDSMNF